MSIEKLGKYIKEYSVRNKLDENIPIYSVTNTKGFCQNYFDKDVSSKNKKNYKIVPRNAFAYNPSRINVGSIDYQHYEEKVIVSPLYNVFIVDEHILPNYLYFYLKNKNTIKRIKNVASGSVRDNLKFSMLCEFLINIPNIQTQKIIIENLDICQNLIRKQMKILQKLDDLVKARFVEMFHSYPEVKLRDVAIIVMGQSPSSEFYNDIGNGIPFFQGKVDYGDKYTIVRHWTNQATKIVNKNTILMSVRAPVGPVNLANERCCIGRGLCGIEAIQDKINNDFLYYALKIKESQISHLGTGSTFKSISRKIIENIKIPNTPFEYQKRFSEFAQQIDKSKFVIQKSLEKTQMLFDSLMQEYFG